MDDAALATAVAANFAAAAISRAAAAAFFAAIVPLELDGFGDAVGGFFERERDVAADVASFLLTAALASATAAEQVAE